MAGSFALSGCGGAPAASERVVRWRVEGATARLRYVAPPTALRPSPVSVAAPGARLTGASIEAIMTDMSMPPVRLVLRPAGDGTYQGRLLLTMGGPWLYVVTLRFGDRVAVRRVRVWAEG
ncbi:MAG: hypothetical protein K6V73_12730 [Firmicutes bacterium]|nr:hypothetical protein [Bacillota bacterium]